MLKGIVTGVDGMALTIAVDETTETRVGLDRVHTKVQIKGDAPPAGGGFGMVAGINVTGGGGAANATDAQGFRKGAVSEIKNGDYVEVRGQNLNRADSVRVSPATPEQLAVYDEFRRRKQAMSNPTTVQVSRAGADEVRSLPVERIRTVGEAPPEVPYGQRRKWREEQEKKLAEEQGLKPGEDFVAQEDDPEDEAPADGKEDPNADLNDMTVEDKRELAKREGINLHGATTTKDIDKHIRAHRRKAGAGK